MVRIRIFLLLAILFTWSGASQAAVEGRQPALAGTPPVNTNIAAAGSLPQGVFFSALNASFAHKENSERGGGNLPDIYSHVWLLKLRYGLTDYLELCAVAPYVNLNRTQPRSGPKHLEGFGDVTAGLNFSPFNLHQGDPVALSFTAGLMLPTGQEGSNRLPGQSAWGGRASTALGAFVTPNLKLDTEFVWTAPFERGNQKVKRGDLYLWNAQARYVWLNYDVGLESSLGVQKSGELERGGSKRDLRNGYTEWFVGPSFNIGFANIGAWAGAGVFFPVYQHFDGPNKSEYFRAEFKIGKLW